MNQKANYPINKFKNIETPFYYYDLEVLKKTLATIKSLELPQNYEIHYALKANVNERVLSVIKDAGLGADCVSGGEIKAALDAGFPASKIVFAGVGKADWEINLALDNNIACFNVESIAELEVINELAEAKNQKTRIALRINPNVSANTHKYIMTGTNENKFGINMEAIDEVLTKLESLKQLQLIGLHFHIGSQLLEMNSYENLCIRINELQEQFKQKGVELNYINVGGGLGIDYNNPNENPIPNFEKYFKTFQNGLKLREGQSLHFELGRSIVAQCGSLISKVLYVKEGTNKNFLIVDAGMTDLLRPALYQAFHKVENLSSDLATEKYDVVGPICESSDVFAKEYEMNYSKRGDIIAFRSAGAYGEIMASRYNLRAIPQSITSEDI